MVTLHVNSSFGIASARHCTCVQRPGIENVLDVPLGMSVCRWEANTGKRSLFFQAHSDAIMGMRSSPTNSWIVTTSYGGEVKLWSMEWKLLATQRTPAESVSYVSFSKLTGEYVIYCKNITGGVVSRWFNILHHYQWVSIIFNLLSSGFIWF